VITLADALALGRISNLPTVWTNTLTGVVLAGGTLQASTAPALFVALTLFYLGGMYLNDWFDAAIDAVERPERPIPSGRVSRSTVGALGYAMLVGGLGCLLVVSTGAGSHWPFASGTALAACIVLYDRFHKGNPASPLIMGACRMLIYVVAGLSVAATLSAAVIIGALVLLAYLIGLTYVAKQENLGRVSNMWPLVFLAAPVVYGCVLAIDEPVTFIYLAALAAWIVVSVRFVFRAGPGDIPRAVVSLIAGISLLDAMLVSAAGSPALAVLCVAGFALTLLGQRYVSGT
jgi:4-hydroxybenzoate polyprenyltransferase